MVGHVEAGGSGTTRARPRGHNRVRYAMREFLSLPALIVGVWVVLAVAAIVLDRNAEQWGQPVRQTVAMVVPPEATSTLLSTITPGLLTVISIIFFVLIMSVQHQSTTYSPVVLDQFLRRKVNQVFFGMFVGLTVYSLLTLGLVPPGQAIVSGALALLLSVATFGSLLVFVYSAVDQVRPSATVWMLQQLALQAREGRQPLLARCRAQSQLPGDAPAAEVIAERVGYVVGIDVHRLARDLGRMSGQVEVELQVNMGDHVVPGALLAQVRGGDSQERSLLAETVLDALTLGRMRDLGSDASQAVDNLGSMAWSATAGSADPEGARVATETLHSLLVEFQDQDRRHSAEEFGGPLPLVYRDGIIGKILDGLTSVIVASAQSGQHQTASTVLTLLCRAIPRLEPAYQQVAVDRLQRVLSTAMNHVFTADIEQAFDAMHQALIEAGLHDGARRINQLQRDLQQYNRLGTPVEE